MAFERNNLAKTTFNFINSDIHLLNSGFYSYIWKNFSPKSKDKVILRLDGIGVDSANNSNKKFIKENIQNLIGKSSYLVFQSKFSRDCFKSIYGSLPDGEVIRNGSIKIGRISKFSIKIQNNLDTHFRKRYFVVAGRFTNRKRINEIINAFNNYEIGNLVVLSDVPANLKVINKRILYLGMINSETARNVIKHSIGLIHLDRYDWCPNLVISAVYDGVPVICSNYGGTPEIIENKNYIINEFPKGLPSNIEGIKFAQNVNFPSLLFRERISEIWNKELIRKPIDSYDIKYTAEKYINAAKNLLK